MNTHTFSSVDRNNLNISGINKVKSFDKEEFLLDTVMGFMEIKGEELEIVKLDTIEGNIAIKGKINSIIYTDVNKKKENGFVNRLFK